MLVPLTRQSFEQMLPLTATGPQYAYFWGNWSDFLRRLLISMVSLTLFWLLGKLFGDGFLAIKLLIDIIAGMYWLWAPVYWAGVRNGSYRRLPYCGFWRGRVLDAFITEEYVGQEERVNKQGELVIIENRERRINIEIGDQSGFTTIVQAPLQRVHKSIRPGMIAEALVFSKVSDLSDIAKVSDVHLPQVNLWVGEYPALRRDFFRTVSAELGGRKETRTPYSRSAPTVIRRRRR
ncbi:MAG: hypothetical protein N5P05_002584 [Chroococcopsis gigantea SAG 12.99]|jgi:hypothetical protein|nr:phosphate ABC transporter permease [Chlorogloea purpurea SAG 13.99]MDV3000978.1 hypothetical protein [Chroococcopsis gigantea SAG 12.99]